MNRIVKVIVGLMVLALFATGCSSVSTDSDEAALHYKGGSASSSKFANCVDSSTRNWDGPGDAHYLYPKGQRTFSFTGKKGSETDPIAVTTGSQEVLIGGFVTFTLNTDCKTLREFHEKVGKKYEAYKDGKGEGGKKGDGWKEFLNDYILVPLNASLNKAAGAIEVPEGTTADQNWYRLYTVSAVQTDFEEYVKQNLPDEIEKTLGAKFITVNAVSISKPDVSGELKKSLSAKEQARLDNEAQKERNTQVLTQFDTIKNCLDTGLDKQSCTLIFLSQNGADIPFLPVPQGGNINYSQQAK